MARRVRRNMSQLQKLEKDASNLEMHLNDVSQNFLSKVVSEANSDQAKKFEHQDVINIDLPRQKAQQRKLARMRKQIRDLQQSQKEA
ncbi:hypothetical protein WR164_03730 [Philodulcilactobacillus myokoensis]|uniref:Uncharacterized protein n=1 Tax=Philodulcilactobacillus myokoensis TaxID=2929573 RepID=A0A9W6B1H9_9LACO|nr:hypothetical protein [Philodulcilactobacillus myokoensis]GLB46394.1 hypothetical protein WR164_03730 [Philodulcilactobacillus myokoensis]